MSRSIAIAEYMTSVSTKIAQLKKRSAKKKRNDFRLPVLSRERVRTYPWRPSWLEFWEGRDHFLRNFFIFYGKIENEGIEKSKNGPTIYDLHPIKGFFISFFFIYAVDRRSLVAVFSVRAISFEKKKIIF